MTQVFVQRTTECGIGTKDKRKWDSIAVDNFACEPGLYKFEIMVSFKFIFHFCDFNLLTLGIFTDNNLIISPHFWIENCGIKLQWKLKKI